MEVDKSKEYEMLRAEMMEYYRAITQYGNILYTAVAAILVFALQKDAFYLCLVPYIVILPLYLLTEAKSRGICKIAAYMYVFLEGGNYFWEHRHHIIDKIQPGKRGSLIPYFYLAPACSACAIYKIVIIPRTVPEYIFKIGFVVLVTVVTLIIMAKNKVNYVSVKDSFIEEWEKLKKAEEAKAEEHNQASKKGESKKHKILLRHFCT